MTMTTDEFESQLRRDGYLEIKHRFLDQGIDTQAHCHDFDTRLLVQQGELTLVCGDTRRTYRAGEILEIPAGALHCECYAPEPIRFVAGLRGRAATPQPQSPTP